MKCIYCGSEMTLDDSDSCIARGGKLLVDKFWLCNHCNASALEELLGSWRVDLEFYPPEKE